MEGTLPPITPAELVSCAFEGRFATIIARLPEWPELDESRIRRPKERNRASMSGIIGDAVDEKKM